VRATELRSGASSRRATHQVRVAVGMRSARAPGHGEPMLPLGTTPGKALKGVRGRSREEWRWHIALEVAHQHDLLPVGAHVEMVRLQRREAVVPRLTLELLGVLPPLVSSRPRFTGVSSSVAVRRIGGRSSDISVASRQRCTRPPGFAPSPWLRRGTRRRAARARRGATPGRTRPRRR